MTMKEGRALLVSVLHDRRDNLCTVLRLLRAWVRAYAGMTVYFSGIPPQLRVAARKTIRRR
jgi:hypothetical protein